MKQIFGKEYRQRVGEINRKYSEKIKALRYQRDIELSELQKLRSSQPIHTLERIKWQRETTKLWKEGLSAKEIAIRVNRCVPLVKDQIDRVKRNETMKQNA